MKCYYAAKEFESVKTYDVIIFKAASIRESTDLIFYIYF